MENKEKIGYTKEYSPTNETIRAIGSEAIKGIAAENKKKAEYGENDSRKTQIKDYLDIRSNINSNGVVYPERCVMDINRVDDFLEAPDSELVARYRKKEGMVQYDHKYYKKDIDEIVLTKKLTLYGNGSYEVGELVRNDSGIFEEINTEETRERISSLWDKQHAEEIAGRLGLDKDKLKLDKISDVILYNGLPIKAVGTWAYGSSKKDYSIVASENKDYSPLERRIYARINTTFLTGDGPSNRRKGTAVFYKGHILKPLINEKLGSMWYETEDEMRELMADLDITGDEPYWMTDEEKKGTIDNKRHRFVINLSPSKSETIITADDIISMAKDGLVDAKKICQSLTLLEEKEEFGKIFEVE